MKRHGFYHIVFATDTSMATPGGNPVMDKKVFPESQLEDAFDYYKELEVSWKDDMIDGVTVQMVSRFVGLEEDL